MQAQDKHVLVWLDEDAVAERAYALRLSFRCVPGSAGKPAQLLRWAYCRRLVRLLPSRIFGPGVMTNAKASQATLAD